jgi:hypothetical protein
MRIGDGLRIGVAGACACVTVVLGLPPTAVATEVVSQALTTPGEQPFVVPPGVTSVKVTLVGGNGAAGTGAPGGPGATVSGTLTVSPGETLYAEVGGNGVALGTGINDMGGYNGGGAGGLRQTFGTASGGGGGGGASDVRRCSPSAPPVGCGVAQSLASRLLVAGGGGGGGGNGESPPTTAGGNGGPADMGGNAGAYDTRGDQGGSGGLRGTASYGGAAGSPSVDCTQANPEACPSAGQLGSGGVGGYGLGGGGGGGGGGIFGGGGGGGGAGTIEPSFAYTNGGGGGGGGGSSGVPTGATGVSSFAFAPTAEGAQPSITFSWTPPPPAVITTTASAITETTATLNGTVNPNAWQPTACGFALFPAPAGVSAFPCAQQLAIGIAPIPVSATAAGLTPGTKYTVTLTASTVQGAGSGASVSFTTPSTIGTGKSGASVGTALSLTSVKLSPTTFRRGKHLATIAKTKVKQKKTVPTATTISFLLSEAATVTLSLEQSSPGVLSGHKCVMKSKVHRQGHSCIRYVPVHGGVSRGGHAGLDKIHFEGILDASKPLPAGAYRLSLKASNRAGSVTAAQHPTFKLTV